MFDLSAIKDVSTTGITITPDPDRHLLLVNCVTFDQATAIDRVKRQVFGSKPVSISVQGEHYIHGVSHPAESRKGR